MDAYQPRSLSLIGCWRGRVVTSRVLSTVLTAALVVGGIVLTSHPAHAAAGWSTIAPMPTPRGDLAAATGSDGRMYAIGGSDIAANGSTLVYATAEAYAPSTNTWSTAAPMPTARYGLAAVEGTDGRIYAIGGMGADFTPTATVEAYTPSANS